MNVSLTPELQEFITREVDSGRYRSASEAVRAGIRLLEEQTREREAKLAYLRAAAEKGLLRLDRGEGIKREYVFRELLGDPGSKP